MRLREAQSAATAREIPLRIRAAAALLILVGLGPAAWTVVTTVPLMLHPDPMFGLELIVNAMLIAAAAGVAGLGIALVREATWARPIAIGVAGLLIVIGGALPFMNPVPVSSGLLPIDPVTWFLVGLGIVLFGLVTRRYP